MDNDIRPIIREHLRDFEQTPPNKVWESIEKDLSKKSASRVFHLQPYAIAASIALVAVVSMLIFSGRNNTKVENIASHSLKPEALQPATKENTVTAETARVQAEEKTQTQKVTNAIAENNLPAEEVEKTFSISSSGSTKEVFLPDSSKASLKEHSTITYTSNYFSSRQITFSGEAYFEIQSDSKNPFIIEGNNSVTKVTGTSFLLKSGTKGETDEIYVTSGKVLFSATGGKQSKTAMLTASQKATTASLQVTAFSDKNLLAWKTRSVEFENTQLQQVCETLEKYFNVKIEIANPAVKTCSFTGTFKEPSLETILKLLQATSEIQYKKTEKGYTLSGKGCR